MGTSHEIQTGLDLQKRHMGAGFVTDKRESSSTQIGIPIQVRIRIRSPKVQSPVGSERLQARAGHRLR